MPPQRDRSYENDHYIYSSKADHRKPRRPNKNFLTTLHVFIALVLLDCIAEQQQKRSRRLYEASSKPRDRRTRNPVIVVRETRPPTQALLGKETAVI